MKRFVCRGRHALLAGATALALVVFVPSAWAGTAKVYGCQLPGGGVAPTDGWSEDTNTGGQPEVDGANRCPSGGALTGEFYWPGTSWTPGPHSGWQFTAPPDTTIAELAFDRRIYGLGGGAWKYYVFIGGSRVEHQDPARNDVGWVRRVFSTDGETTAKILLACGGPASCQRTTLDTTAAAVGIRAMVVTLRDPHAPEVSAVSGPLAEAETLRGTETLSFTASDRGMGLYRAFVNVDGQDVSATIVDPNDGRCADAGADETTPYEFVRRVPCKLSASGEVSLDTTTLADGEHTLRVQLEDAAGNRVTAAGPRKVVVDNVPPPALLDGSAPQIEGSPRAGDALRAMPGEWTGEGIAFSYQWLRCDADGGACAEIAVGTDRQYLVSGRDVGSRLRVRVTATNAEGSTSATSAPTPVIAPPATTESRTPVPEAPASTQRGAPNGSGATERARLSAYVGKGRSTTIRVPHGRATRITGRLADAEGNPIRGAVVNVQVGVRMPGTALEDVGTVTTDRNGEYAYTLPPGPSRLVRFAYRSHLGDTHFADTTDVVVMVRAGVTLKPRPTKLRNGSATTFTGTVARPLPRRGVLVDLQARVGKRWRTFAVARTNRSGRYRVRYRFRNTYRTTTFKFRARVRRDSSYPYLDGFSRTVRVHVKAR